MSSSNIVEVEPDSSEAVVEDPEFLKELEELAKGRYSDQDEEYMGVKLRGSSKPPIQLSYPSNNRGWRGGRGRSGGYNGHQPRRDRDAGYDRNCDRNRSYDRNRDWDRSHDRHRDGGYERRSYGRQDDTREHYRY